MTKNYDNYNIYDIIYEMGLGDFDADLEYDEILEILKQYEVTKDDIDYIKACNRELSKIRRLGIEEYNRECISDAKKDESYSLQRNNASYSTRGLKRAIIIGTIVVLLATGIKVAINQSKTKSKETVTRPAVTTSVPYELNPQYGRITYIVKSGDFNISLVAKRLGLDPKDVHLAPGEKFYPTAGEEVDFYVPIDFANDYNYMNKENDEKELIFVYNLKPGESIDDICSYAKNNYKSLYSGLSLAQFRKKLLEENPHMFTDGYNINAFMAGKYRVYSYITQHERDTYYSEIPYVDGGEIVDYYQRVTANHYSESSDDEIGAKSVG